MLFVVHFVEDRTPLLLDARDETHARAMAAAIGEGAPLKRADAIAVGVFAAELFTTDEDGNEIVVDPFDEVADLLERIDASADDAPDEPFERCPSEADGDGDEVLRCELSPGHEGQHEATSEADGEIRQWSDA